MSVVRCQEREKLQNEKVLLSVEKTFLDQSFLALVEPVSCEDTGGLFAVGEIK